MLLLPVSHPQPSASFHKFHGLVKRTLLPIHRVPNSQGNLCCSWGVELPTPRFSCKFSPRQHVSTNIDSMNVSIPNFLVPAQLTFHFGIYPVILRQKSLLVLSQYLLLVFINLDYTGLFILKLTLYWLTQVQLLVFVSPCIPVYYWFLFLSFTCNL